MGTPLPDRVKELLDAPTFVVVTTVNPDGGPQASVVWVKRDGDAVLMSSIRGRRKTLNLEREPRVSVCAYDPDDPYYYFELRGRVTISDEGGRELIDELSRKYRGKDYPEEPEGTVRVVIRLEPDKIVDYR